MADIGMGVIRILIDHSTEYCGKAETHDYQLYLAINDIEHTKTKVRHPQTNSICERFHRTILDEFYKAAFRKKIYENLKELQNDLDAWLFFYNNERTHQGKICCGRTPMDKYFELCQQTPFSDEVQTNYYLKKERIQEANYKIDLQFRKLK